MTNVMPEPFTYVFPSAEKGPLFTKSQMEAYADARVREAQQWKPIETAPVNEWCLFLDGSKSMLESRYGQFVHADKILEGSGGHTLYAYLHNYTHWMPLPAPPSTPA